MIPGESSLLKTARDKVTSAPLDPVAHLELGDVWKDRGRPVAAAACYRTAMALEDESTEAAVRLEALGSSAREVPDGAGDHNRHYRMSSLASYLIKIAGGDTFDILDVGGGDGLLAQYLPRTGYRLAEPATNGIHGESLPFPARSIDVVCACHVLEHVPPGDRFKFLDSLRLRARHHLVLLNPFLIPGSHYRERLRTMIDLTGASWAREHLECGFPELSTVEEYARDRGLACRIMPNGNMPAAFLVTLVRHYANLAGRGQDLRRIDSYLNSLDPEMMTHPRLPGAMLVHFSLDQATG